MEKTSYHRNIPLFIAFRVFFNARFYYPVLGVLFLDLGLSLQQYSLLNVIWAVAIVTLEIPSGALADVIGRKRMVVLAAVLMVVEMAIFAFAPAGNPMLLFWLLACNRFLSGAAEACASGADEALAYDSLAPIGREQAWPKVLVSLMRWQSGAFFFAMVVGAALFDAAFVGQVAGFLGWDWAPVAKETVRWPVLGTLLTSFACLFVALAMREPREKSQEHGNESGRALRNIWLGARYVGNDQRILLLLLAVLVSDSVVRLFMTFESNYLRLITVPAAWYGIIGSSLALLGFVVAPIARKLVKLQSAPRNFAILGILILFGLTGAGLSTSLVGIWVILPLGFAMSLLQFFSSHYLNTWTSSELRATVLSFRGVALNIGYGMAGILFAALTARLRAQKTGASENEIFASSLFWLPVAFVIGAAGVLIFGFVSRRQRAV